MVHSPIPYFYFTHLRIIAAFGLEGTFRGHLAKSLCSEQGHLQLDQVARSPIQPGLDCFQEWGLHYISGQYVTVFHHPHDKKLLAYIQSISTLPQFKTIAACPIAKNPVENIFPFFPIGPPSGTERLL